MPVKRLAQLSAYTVEQLRQEVVLWQDMRHIRWRWLSPVRLLKDKEQCEGLEKEARFCRDSPDLSGQLILNRVHDTFAGLLRERGEKTPARGVPPNILINQSHLF
jgi:hypothetical protein